MRFVPGQLPVSFNRKFHLSGYMGGHARVLFRSGRSGYHRGEHLKYGTVLDIEFKNVAALAIAESYFALEISLASPDEIAAFQSLLHCPIGDRKLYALRGDDSVGYVLASAVYWFDDPVAMTEDPSVFVDDLGRGADVEVFRA